MIRRDHHEVAASRLSTSRRRLAATAVAALIVAIPTTRDAGATSDPPPSGETLNLPAPPAPMPPGADERATVTAIVDAFEHRGDGRAAALLAASALARVTVVDPTGAVVVGDGAVGVPWETVYLAATVAEEHVRVNLVDVARLLDDGDEPSYDAQVVAADLLAGLQRAYANPAANGPRIAALIAAEETLRYNGADLTAPTTTPESVYVSVPTATMIVSAGVLDGLRQGAPPPAGLQNPDGFRRFDVAPAAPPDQAPESPGGPCELGNTAQWALWIASKVAGGADLGGVGSWDGLLTRVLERWRGVESATAIAGRAAKASAALTLLSTVVAALTYSANVQLEGGEPLVRTKSASSDGAVDTIAVTVTYDYGAFGPDLQHAIDCLLVALGAIGNNATLPSSGPIGAGVRVTASGQEGFGHGLDTAGQFVALHMPLSTETDASGTARFTVTGLHQHDQIPDDALPFERTFSVALSAQVDPTDASSILKMFFDSILCVGATNPTAAGCVDPFNDLIRQFNWDLGAWAFTLRDWSRGWAIHFDETLPPGADGFSRWDAVNCGTPYDDWHLTLTMETTGLVSYDVYRDVVLNEQGIGTTMGSETSTWIDPMTFTGSSYGTAQLTPTDIGVGFVLELDVSEDGRWDYADDMRDASYDNTSRTFTYPVIPATPAEC